MLNQDLLTVFLMGLLGSVHCVGMCGGIASLLGGQVSPGDMKNGQATIKQTIIYSLLYNIGRITSYVVAGILIAALGLVTAHAGQTVGIPDISRLVIGVLTIFFGFYLLGWTVFLSPLEKTGHLVWRYIEPFASKFLPVRSPAQALLLGLLWGWLPCGMVYVALSWSVVAAEPIQGGLLMAAFGLGTMPAMFAIGAAGVHIRKMLASQQLRTAIGIFVVFYGLYMAAGFFMGTASHSHH